MNASVNTPLTFNVLLPSHESIRMFNVAQSQPGTEKDAYLKDIFYHTRNKLSRKTLSFPSRQVNEKGIGFKTDCVILIF